MVMKEASIVVIISIIAIAAAIGIVSSKILGHDNFIEESLENFIGSTLEKTFGLPDDSLNIDLTPSSKERD